MYVSTVENIGRYNNISIYMWNSHAYVVYGSSKYMDSELKNYAQTNTQFWHKPWSGKALQNDSKNKEQKL